MIHSNFTVDHVRVIVDKPFEAFCESFEQRLGRFDPSVYKELETEKKPQEVRDTLEAMVGPSGFMLFETRNHGLVLALLGKPSKALQYVVGNPLFAVEMTSTPSAPRSTRRCES